MSVDDPMNIVERRKRLRRMQRRYLAGGRPEVNRVLDETQLITGPFRTNPTRFMNAAASGRLIGGQQPPGWEGMSMLSRSRRR
jgi:hypothetical protein